MENKKAIYVLEDFPVLHNPIREDVREGVYDLTKLFESVLANGGKLSLGRLPECDIPVGRKTAFSSEVGCNNYLAEALKTVSRVHAFLKINSQGVSIEDNSQRGTRVYTQILEGNPMFLTVGDRDRTSSVLTSGDFIYLGEYGPLRFMKR